MPWITDVRWKNVKSESKKSVIRGIADHRFSTNLKILPLQKITKMDKYVYLVYRVIDETDIHLNDFVCKFGKSDGKDKKNSVAIPTALLSAPNVSRQKLGRWKTSTKPNRRFSKSFPPKASYATTLPAKIPNYYPYR